MGLNSFLLYLAKVRGEISFATYPATYSLTAADDLNLVASTYVSSGRGHIAPDRLK